MKILQISDLHLSEATEPLFNERWNRASTWFSGQFDFIVVSGDIADKAQPADYEIALKRLGELIPLVKDQDRARIVIVPGNHDVSWQSEVGRALLPAEIEGERKSLAELLDWGPELPAQYNRRFEISLDGPTTVWAVNAGKYAERFIPFATFLKDFYDPPLKPPHRTFVANARDSREHWSAHVFPGDKIAFFGLSSCLINDKHSRSAALCENALADVNRYMKSHAQGLRKVAVWHHGLVSPRGRPDSVSRVELANLRQGGFSLGLHGHTHHDSRERIRGGYYGDLLVLGTGAFSVSHEKIEEGYNQFSIIELNEDQTTWTVYDYKRGGDGWTPRPPVPFVPNAPSLTLEVGGGGNLINRHTRKISVDEDGIATVEATMEGLSLKKRFTVGTPSPGFTDVRWDRSPKVIAPKHAGRVEITIDPAGQKSNRHGESRSQKPYRFVASTQRPIEVDSLEWSYSIANGFALDDVDAMMGLYPGREDLSLGPTDDPRDGFAYRVEDRTKRLTLWFELPETSEILEPTIVAERGDHSASEIDWAYDVDDEARATLTRHGKNRLEIAVENPRIGSRYGAKYRLGRVKTPIGARYLNCINDVIDSCRRAVPSRAPDFVAAVANVLRNALGKKRLTDLKFWTAHLWDSRVKQLRVCFGAFSMEHWSSAFYSGQGIAGHAFRMCEATVYCASKEPREAREKRSLLYLPRAEDDAAHQVVIELPILLDGDHAVGTIGFSVRTGDGQSHEAHDRLTATAHHITFGPDDAALKAKRLLDKVATEASRAFWAEVKNTHPNVAEEASHMLRGRAKPRA